MTVQSIELDGKRLFVLTQEAFEELMERAGVLPPLPSPDRAGNSDAVAFARAAIARKLAARRIRAGWTQKELARRAGVRLETVCRLESGKHSPTRETIARLDHALAKAETRRARQHRSMSGTGKGND
jgi:DNA-binding XRE family transcriptional regulator